MPRKPKFKPVITRVKLNPEQAVLSCSCYTGSGRPTRIGPTYSTGHASDIIACSPSGRGLGLWGTSGCGAGPTHSAGNLAGPVGAATASS